MEMSKVATTTDRLEILALIVRANRGTDPAYEQVARALEDAGAGARIDARMRLTDYAAQLVRSAVRARPLDPGAIDTIYGIVGLRDAAPGA